MYRLIKIFINPSNTRASQVALVVKNSPASADLRDEVRSLGWEVSPGGGHGIPLQYSCLENPMDKRNLEGS